MRRTTVTIDADVDALLKTAMRERGLSFKEALNQSIRGGLSGSAPARKAPKFKMKTYRMGTPRVDLTKALRLAAEMEDEEILRKMRRAGK